MVLREGDTEQEEDMEYREDRRQAHIGQIEIEIENENENENGSAEVQKMEEEAMSCGGSLVHYDLMVGHDLGACIPGLQAQDSLLR